MRSYYEHLETASGAKKAVTPKPVFRSSAIFPVFNLPGISSRILFMGYWILKRNIKHVATVVTLRSLTGEPLFREQFLIEEAKTYRVELSDYLEKSGFSPSEEFVGSMEVEFFSTNNFVFPYPATAINYYGPQFCSIVHTAQRVYNNFEDMQNNTQTQVPESGFNIYCSDDEEPFFALINGPESAIDFKIGMQFFNADKETLSHELNLGNLKPYQTVVVYPAQHVDLKSFLKGKVGAGKINFKLKWIFPRLIAGNVNHSLPAVNITHTYYDCSAAQAKSDYWLESQPQYYPATLMIPVAIANSQFTNIYFYPIYSPSTFFIDVEIYNSSGKKLGQKKDVLKITSPASTMLCVDFKALCKELNIPIEKDLAARLIARAEGDNRIPARIKLALDMGDLKHKEVPCNICMNLQPFNPPWENKPGTFKWSPVLADQPEAPLWIMNSSPLINYNKHADLELTFFRENDDSTLTRVVTLSPHGFTVIRPSQDQELQQFFEGKVGWCTVKSNNPYTTNYYFALNPSGAVGGDHGF